MSLISMGVEVSVKSRFMPNYSNPMQQQFMHQYTVHIYNHNVFPITVLGRHWFISDGDGVHMETKGEGIVGITPTILPGSEYSYISGCNLHAEIGSMEGQYTVRNEVSQQEIQVDIPRFMMVYPPLNN